jgi:hypothetical protein
MRLSPLRPTGLLCIYAHLSALAAVFCVAAQS